MNVLSKYSTYRIQHSAEQRCLSCSEVIELLTLSSARLYCCYGGALKKRSRCVHSAAGRHPIWDSASHGIMEDL